MRSVKLYLDKGGYEVDGPSLEQLVRVTCDQQSVREDVSLSVSFVDERRIEELNKQYREKAGATDVLSFAFEEADVFFGEEPGSARQLGDVYICLPVVRQNAKRLHRDFDQELDFVVVHSILHLLGYDHLTMQTEHKMNKLTESIINEKRRIWDEEAD